MNRSVSRPRLAIRVLVLVVAIAAALPSGRIEPERAEAANGFPVYATVTTEKALRLRSKPGSKKVVTSLAPGTQVKVFKGPNADGWYKIDAVDLPKAKRCWAPAEAIAISQHVRASWDLNLLAGPSDRDTALTWIRHGIVLSVVRPGEGDYLLVRYGDVVGYAFVPALTAAEGPATEPWDEWWVDVNRSTAEVHLMIGETVVDAFSASLGRDQGEGFYATASGTYHIYSKVKGLSYTKYAKAYIAYWAGFDPSRDNGFHAWTMDKRGNVIDGGWGPTGGCVATRPEEAAIVFDFVDIGTRVEIHWKGRIRRELDRPLEWRSRRGRHCRVGSRPLHVVRWGFPAGTVWPGVRSAHPVAKY